MDIKEMTVHLRGRIKAANIKARVRFWPDGLIQVFVSKPGMEFSEEEQKTIRHIAVCNKLSWVRGQPIDVNQMTNPHTFNFYMPS